MRTILKVNRQRWLFERGIDLRNQNNVKVKESKYCLTFRRNGNFK